MSASNRNLLHLTLALILVSILFSACSGNSSEMDITEPSALPTEIDSESASREEYPGGNEDPEAATPINKSQDPLFAPAPTSNPAQRAVATLPPGQRLDDDEAAQLMADLIGSDQDASEDALEAIVEAGDTRFVAVLIEMMRGRQISIIGGIYSDYIEALEDLSGQRFGGDWPAWVEWYGMGDLQPPPGFTGWKGLLLGRIDPGFDDFLQDDFPTRIRVEEIQWGGVPIDGIPPLESAPTLPGIEADYLEDTEPVFGLVVNGDARAYPLRIIDNHEMANDVIGGAAIAYDGRATDGKVYDFGTSGFLYRSNKLMYDRQTRTLWNQLTGEPVLGELADQDVKLDILPVVLTSWSDWLIQHPDTLVLDRNTGYYPPETYIPGIFYGEYFASSDTMFPVWQRSGLLPPKEFVYTLHFNGVPKAYQVEALVNDQVLNDSIGEVPIVLIANRGAVTVNGQNQYVGEVYYDVGGEVRAYDRGDEIFEPGEDPDTVIDGAGNSWQVTEEALVGPDGKIAPRIAGHLAYWFGWYAFFPNTQLYSTSSTGGD